MIAAENSNEMDLIGYRVVQAQEAGLLSRLRGKLLLVLQRESIVLAVRQADARVLMAVRYGGLLATN